MKDTILNFIKKYKHSIIVLYLPFYMTWFLWLEGRDDVTYHSISCIIDDWIPFNELFAIPYFLWFGYVVIVLVFLFFQLEHLEDFYRCAATLILGMTTALIIYTVWPNSQPLPPGDTSTNVCPSLHVYNSLAIHVGLAKSHFFQNKKGWKAASLILCILICLSTVFLKQHSVIDGICALIMYGVYYVVVYKPYKK